MSFSPGFMSFQNVPPSNGEWRNIASARAPNTETPLAKQRIVFAYNSSIEHEVQSYRSGEVPSHRLFGLADVASLGHHTDFIRQNRVSRLTGDRGWRLYQALMIAFSQEKYDAVFATHESAAYSLLLLKKIGFLRLPLIVINIGMLTEKRRTGKIGWFLRCFLSSAEAVVSYASRQCELLQKHFSVPKEKLFFIPLGVDTDYFTVCQQPPTAETLLSVGSNSGRDFPTLLKALPDSKSLLIITDEYNLNIVQSSRRPDQKVETQIHVPISRLRELYQSTPLHIIPLLDVPFSVGQTILLENMAMGRVMIVTGTIATEDYAQHNVNAIVVPPGNSDQLRDAINLVTAYPRTTSTSAAAPPPTSA